MADYIFSYGNLEEKDFDLLLLLGDETKLFLRELLKLDTADPDTVRVKKRLIMDHMAIAYTKPGKAENLGTPETPKADLVSKQTKPDPSSLTSSKKIRAVLRPEFMAILGNGVCATVDAQVFFSSGAEGVKKAQEHCAGCSLRARCGEIALLGNEGDGVWGGISKKTRGKAISWLGLQELAPEIARFNPDHSARIALQVFSDNLASMTFGKESLPRRPTAEQKEIDKKISTEGKHVKDLLTKLLAEGKD